MVLVAAGLALAVHLLHFNVDSALLGLALSYAIGVTNALNWMVILLALQVSHYSYQVVTGTSTEAEMSRVERILHYCATPSEPPLTTRKGSQLAAIVSKASWPRTGRIEFENAVMSYRPTLPPVKQL